MCVNLFLPFLVRLAFEAVGAVTKFLVHLLSQERQQIRQESLARFVLFLRESLPLVTWPFRKYMFNPKFSVKDIAP